MLIFERNAMLIRGNLKAVSIVLVATSLALGGCGKKEDEEEEEETELEGSWKSSCFALDGEEGVYKYSQNVVKVEGAKMMRVDSRQPIRLVARHQISFSSSRPNSRSATT
jgi:hypothetical protein